MSTTAKVSGAQTLRPAQVPQCSLPLFLYVTVYVHAHVGCGCVHVGAHMSMITWRAEVDVRCSFSCPSPLYLLKQGLLLNLEFSNLARLAANEAQGPFSASAATAGS